MPVCQYSPSSDEYYDFIIRYSPRSPDLYQLALTHCVNFISRDFAVVHAPRSDVEPFTISQYSYGIIPKLYGLLDTTALEDSGIPPVFDQPSLLSTGKGSIIGIADTGIDYTNPLFRTSDGATRILGIWDQTLDSDEPLPEIDGYQPLYGSVFSQEQINAALNAQDPYEIVPSKDTDGHGTFMAGVAAGSRVTRPAPFFGAAPDASLIIVKLKPAKQYLRNLFLIRPDATAFQENDIMAAISYMSGLANQYDMPIVFYLGLGTNQGNHEGTTPLGQQLRNMEGYSGTAAVAAAGNEVGLHHHYRGNMPPNQVFDDVELRVGSDETGFCTELWAKEPDLYTVGFVSPSGEIIDRIPLSLGSETVISLKLDSTVITINYQNNESGSGSQLIFMRFQAPSPGIWHIRIYPLVYVSGSFHLWLPMDGFLSKNTMFLRPDPDNTITDPGNASMPLTVSTYNHGNNSIYIHSSRGYTPDGRIKPDLAAPGVEVQGPALTPLGADLRFTRRTGSSVAAALTAGAVADLFTWGVTNNNNQALSGAAIKSMLIRGANRSQAFTYPNPTWGFGTLNLYQAFLRIRE